MAQPTAVEWFADKIDSIIPYCNEKTSYEFIKLLEQAKQMEKKQIVKAYNDAINKMDYFIQPESAEQYYTQTYSTRLQNETN